MTTSGRRRNSRRYIDIILQGRIDPALQRSVAAFDRRVDRLQANARELDRSLRNLSTPSTASNGLTDARMAASGLNTDLRQVSRQLDALSDRGPMRLAGGLREASAAARELRTEATDLRGELGRVSRRLSSFSTRGPAQASAGLADARGEAAELRAEVSRLSAELATISAPDRAAADLRDLGHEARRVTGDVTVLDRRLADLDTRGPRRAAADLRDLSREASRGASDVQGLEGDLRRLGPAVGSVLAVGGIALAVDRLGEASAQILAISRLTGLAVEDVQNIQARANLIGQDLDIGDFTEISNRLGEIREEARRGEEATIGARAALESLGFNPEQIVARDIPAILDALRQVEDQARRAFLGDEIFSSGFERIAPSLNLPPELERRLDNTRRLSEDNLRAFEEWRAESQALTASLTAAGASLLVDFLGPAADALDTVTQLVEGFAFLVEQNPALLYAIGATGAAMLLFAKRQAIANTALAIANALQGPRGWVNLAVAAGVGLAVGGVAIASIRAGQDLRDERQQAQVLGDATRQGAEEGTSKVAEEFQRQQQENLRAITPAVECNDRNIRDLQDAVETPEPRPAPTAADFPFRNPVSQGSIVDAALEEGGPFGGLLSQFRPTGRGTIGSAQGIRGRTPPRLGDPDFVLPEATRQLFGTAAEREAQLGNFFRAAPVDRSGAHRVFDLPSYQSMSDIPLDAFGVGGSFRPVPTSTTNNYITQEINVNGAGDPQRVADETLDRSRRDAEALDR